MKKCSLCSKEKPLTDFNKKSKSKDGLQNICRKCNSTRSKKYYAENKVKHRAVVFEQKKKTIADSRKRLFEYLYNHPCVDCGHSDFRVLEFDHTGEDKTDGVARLVANGYCWATILKEIEKCEVRCRNCHAIKTYERLGGTWHDNFI